MERKNRRTGSCFIEDRKGKGCEGEEKSQAIGGGEEEELEGRVGNLGFNRWRSFAGGKPERQNVPGGERATRKKRKKWQTTSKLRHGTNFWGARKAQPAGSSGARENKERDGGISGNEVFCGGLGCEKNKTKTNEKGKETSIKTKLPQEKKVNFLLRLE